MYMHVCVIVDICMAYLHRMTITNIIAARKVIPNVTHKATTRAVS